MKGPGRAGWSRARGGLGAGVGGGRMVSVTGVTERLARLVNRAPLLRLAGCRGTLKLRTGVVTGLRCFGPLKDMGSEITTTVVRRNVGSKGVGRSAVVVRPADNGAKVKLTFITTSGKLRLVLVVPSAVDIREEGVIATLNTRVGLAPKHRNVGNTVSRTRELGRRCNGTFVPRRFRGRTGPSVRETAATRRV